MAVQVPEGARLDLSGFGFRIQGIAVRAGAGLGDLLWCPDDVRNVARAMKYWYD